MKIVVTLEKEITVEFDENSKEFIELWENYRAYFDHTADYESFSENIAHQVARYGVNEFIEGVGFLKHNGKNQNIFFEGKYEEQEGHVNVEVDTDINKMVDFDITDTCIEEN